MEIGTRTLKYISRTKEQDYCYDLRFLGLDKRTTFVLEKHKRT